MLRIRQFCRSRLRRRAQQVRQYALGGNFATDQTGKQRVRAQSVRAVILIVALTGRIKARHVGHLVAGAVDVPGTITVGFVVAPKPAHRIVHGGIDAHRRLDGVLAHELFVNFEHAFELVIDLLSGVGSAARHVELGDVQINLLASLDALAHAADAVDDEADDVAAEQVAVLRVHLLAHVPAILLRNLDRLSGIHWVARNPNSAAFATDRFRNQSALVFARNCRRVNLYHLRVAVPNALLVANANRRTRVDDRIRGFTEDQAISARAHYGGVTREGLDLHRPEILRGDADTCPGGVLDNSQEFPALVFLHEVAVFPSSNLLIERVQQLLPRSRTGVSRAVLQRSAKAPEGKEPFAGPVEGNTHPVEQIYDRGRALRHPHNRWLVIQEVTPGDRVLEVQIGRVPLATQVHRAIDSALGADAMGALDGDDGKELDLMPRFRELHRGHQSGETTSNDDDCTLRCHVTTLFYAVASFQVLLKFLTGPQSCGAKGDRLGDGQPWREAPEDDERWPR